ncbi:MAG: phage tail tube protein [Thermodesulfobacteriota bacterium]
MSQPSYEKKVQIETATGVWSSLPANSASLQLGREILDDTEMATNVGARSRVYGLKDWTVTANCMWDPASAVLAFIENALLNGDVVKLRYLPDGDIASPGKGFEGQAVVASYNSAGDVGGLETVDITFQADGALARPV